MPDIVKDAFGEPPKSEPVKPEPSDSEPPKTEEPAKPQPAAPSAPSREGKRIQGLLSEIEELKAKLSQIKDSPDVADMIERKFAELEIKRAYSRIQESASANLSEAFPDASERQDFMDMAEHYAPLVAEHAPKAADYIAGSANPYKLEKALYMVCSCHPTAFDEFLKMPFPMQKRNLQALEGSIAQENIAAPNASEPFTPPASLPKSVTPSDSDGGSGSSEPNAYEKTLSNIAMQRSGRG
jgi:hypothetical protein